VDNSTSPSPEFKSEIWRPNAHLGVLLFETFGVRHYAKEPYRNKVHGWFRATCTNPAFPMAGMGHFGPRVSWTSVSLVSLRFLSFSGRRGWKHHAFQGCSADNPFTIPGHEASVRSQLAVGKQIQEGEKRPAVVHSLRFALWPFSENLC
jgi:hypothetical protein